MEEKNGVSVKFTGERSDYNNCVCAACHAIGYVTKLKLPETLFHRVRNTSKLKTEYRNYWLCDECMDKLIKELKGVGDVRNARMEEHVEDSF